MTPSKPDDGYVIRQRVLEWVFQAGITASEVSLSRRQQRYGGCPGRTAVPAPEAPPALKMALTCGNVGQSHFVLSPVLT